MDVQNDLPDFISTYTGKKNVGDTPENTGQCVGLIEKWIDLFGYPHIWGNASDLLVNADTNFYEIIPNSADNFPEEGDIVVFGKPWGKTTDANGNTVYLGHTSIAVVGADSNQFSSFEQNDAVPSDPQGECEIINHNYNGVVGWLRFKNLPTTNATSSNATIPTSATIDWHGLNSNDPESVQVAIDTWWDVANNKYVAVATFTTLQQEFDTYKSQYPQVSPSPTEDQANYTAMKALGYTTVDDINNALKKKDDSIAAIQKDQIVLEQKNEKLADIISEDSKNNYTAMEQGNSAVDKLKEFEGNIQEIAKATEADRPNVKDILNKIFQFKDVYNKFIDKLDKEQASKDEEQFAQKTIDAMQKASQPDIKTDVNWLMKMFNLIPTGKGVK